MRCKLICLPALLCAALQLHAAPARGGEIPVNTWTKISELPTRHANLVPLVWLPEQKRCLVWSALNFRSSVGTEEDYLRLNLFDPATGKWEGRQSVFPEKVRVTYGTKAGCPYVYLPNLKRVLLLGRGNHYSREKVGSWLLDPATARWEPVPGMIRMGHSSKELGSYSPFAQGCGSSNREGWTVPVLGTLVYDAHNKEAVSVGGGEIFGRVEKVKEKVKPGDWIYDEVSERKRVRRLVAADAGKITEARRFYPGHCGTWTFSEAAKKWSPLDQLMSEQPSGRVFPSAAYDAGEKKIVLFGGDDLAGCLADTWIYDCQTKKWSEVKPEKSPPARARAGMIYVPDQKIILMAGGYGTGWTLRSDMWIYETAKSRWTRVGPDLPVRAGYCWAEYLPEKKTVLLRALPDTTYRPPLAHIYALRLDLAGAPRVNGKLDYGKKYHCQVDDRRVVSEQPAPEDFAAPSNRASDPEVVKTELASLPANTWKLLKPPLKVVERRWGTCIYNPKTHKLYAYGGAHSGYQGGDVSEYDLLTNRWDGMADPPEMKPRHHAKMSGDNTQGLPFRGGAWTVHAHRSYEIDPLSDNIVTPYGILYSIEERRYVDMIPRPPGNWGQGNRSDYVTAPHGLYAYYQGGMYRANVAEGKWDTILEGRQGPNHTDQNSMCYDPGRDAIWYFCCAGRQWSEDPAVWRFDFKGKKWEKQNVVGKIPPSMGGWPAYIPELKGVLFTHNTNYRKKPARKGGKVEHFLFNVEEKRWYSAPHKGETSGSYGRLNNDVFWDPELGVVLHAGITNFTEVGIMRLVPSELGLKPLEQ
ncbi:MAG: Kelch repeat-containing protein [Planctomycetota bacterium]|jgi:hypothetical protein